MLVGMATTDACVRLCRGHRVREVIKDIPSGVSKRFPEQRARGVLAYCRWKCLLNDTGGGWRMTCRQFSP